MKYNGWTNYATWRVYLEIFADYDFDNKVYPKYPRDAQFCKDWAEFIVFDDIPPINFLAKDYANAFLAQVNWQEISQHLNEE